MDKTIISVVWATYVWGDYLNMLIDWLAIDDHDFSILYCT